MTVNGTSDGTYLHELEMRIHSTLHAPTVLSKFESLPFQSHYISGQVEIRTEVPGLDGNPEVFIFSCRR